MMTAPILVALGGCDSSPQSLGNSVVSVLRGATPTPTEPRKATLSISQTGGSPFQRDTLRNLNQAIPAERNVQVDPKPIDVSGTPADQQADNYAQYIASATNSDRPDVIAVTPAQLQAFAKANVLLDLGPLLKVERWYKAGDFIGNILKVGQLRGKLLALPVQASAEVLLYSRQTFQSLGQQTPKAEWTWDDALNAARAMTIRGRDAASTRWGFFINATTPSFVSLAWQRGAQVISDDGAQIDITEPGTIQAIEFLASMILVHKVAAPLDQLPAPDTARNAFPPAFTSLTTGQAAMASQILPSVGIPWWRQRDAMILAPLPSTGHRVVLGSADLLIAIPRKPNDEAHSLNSLRAILEAADRMMLMPTRQSGQTGQDPRMTNAGISPGDADTLTTSLSIARFVPGDLNITAQMSKLLESELMVPVLTGRKAALAAAQDVQQQLQQTKAVQQDW